LLKLVVSSVAKASIFAMMVVFPAIARRSARRRRNDIGRGSAVNPGDRRRAQV
jgi:hypothetical protein